MMRWSQLALTGVSTLALILLGLYYSIMTFGAITLWSDTNVTGVLHNSVAAIIALLAIGAFLSIIVTTILQIRKPQPRLLKLTACLTLSWPVVTFSLYAGLIVGIALFTEFSMDYALEVAGTSGKVGLVVIGVTATTLIVPAIRSGLIPTRKFVRPA